MEVAWPVFRAEELQRHAHPLDRPGLLQGQQPLPGVHIPQLHAGEATPAGPLIDSRHKIDDENRLDDVNAQVMMMRMGSVTDLYGSRVLPCSGQNGPACRRAARADWTPLSAVIFSTASRAAPHSIIIIGIIISSSTGSIIAVALFFQGFLATAFFLLLPVVYESCSGRKAAAGALACAPEDRDPAEVV